MRVKRIIAERFGRLEGCSLGDLGEGLTVVLGPNEAGKTSYAALARHVLYGYPRKGSEGNDYLSSSGKRLGRLVFAEGENEWSVERAEGAHGGPVSVEVMSGSARSDLLSTITHGVSRDAFRVVFGFGIDELAQIEAKRGSGDDILSPLYAAQVGLAISPSDVRRGFAESASGLWRKSGSKPALNALKAEIKEVRATLTRLESEATAFAGQQARLTELTLDLEAARARRESTRARHSELLAASQRVEDIGRRIDEVGATERTATAELTDLREKLEQLKIDERVGANATRIEAALSEASLFDDRLERMRVRVERVTSLSQRADDVIAAVGLTREQAAVADVGPQTRAGIERWRDRLSTLSSQAASSARAAQDARTMADAHAHPSGSAVTSTGPGRLLPGIVVMIAGALVAGLALLGGDWLQTIVGAVVIAVGGALVAFSGRGASASGGLEDGDHAARVRAAQLTAQRDASGYEAARTEWRSWLADRGLEMAGEDSAAVSLLVSAIRESEDLRAQRDREQEAVDAERDECEAYRDRLAGLAGGFMPDIAGSELSDVPGHVARIRETVRAHLAVVAQRSEAVARLEQLERDVAEAQHALEDARSGRVELLTRLDLPQGDPLAIAVATQAAAEQAAEATVQHDEIAREEAELSTRLDTGGRDTAMAEARLQLTGLLERQDELLDRYAVYVVAESLMARTQGYSEQARQPEVIRRASEIFAAITGGRYVRISPPDDEGTFRVFDKEAHAKPTAELSTGTAQQLYLAVRIALVEQLDEVGIGLPVLMDDVLVNFDPERRQGTAKAVAELARHRQVVFFTCHPEIAELFDGVTSGHIRLVLDRC